MDKQPSFEKRTGDLKEAAEGLRTMSRSLEALAETVMTEVLHMEAAAKRFQERAKTRGTKRESR